MDRSIVVELIAEAYTVDALRQTVTTETAREVFAAIRSVSRTEWDAAGNQGLRPDFQITMFAPDYEGEKIVKLRGERYAIYRTYIRQDEMIELYVERQVGISNAPQNS